MVSVRYGPANPDQNLSAPRWLHPTRVDSTKATISASSNKTTRALILWRAIFPSFAQRKRVRGQMPRRAAMDFALLKVRLLPPSNEVRNPACDSVFVIMPTLSQWMQPVGDSAAPPNSRWGDYRETGSRQFARQSRTNAAPSTIGYEEPAWLSHDLRACVDERRNTLPSSL